jgi:hypothetical protein
VRSNCCVVFSSLLSLLLCIQSFHDTNVIYAHYCLLCTVVVTTMSRFSHMGWMFEEKTHDERAPTMSNASDLLKQPFYTHMKKFYFAHIMLKVRLFTVLLAYTITLQCSFYIASALQYACSITYRLRCTAPASVERRSRCFTQVITSAQHKSLYYCLHTYCTAL